MATHFGIQGSVAAAALMPLVRPCVRGRGRVMGRVRRVAMALPAY